MDNIFIISFGILFFAILFTLYLLSRLAPTQRRRADLLVVWLILLLLGIGFFALLITRNGLERRWLTHFGLFAIALGLSLPHLVAHLVLQKTLGPAQLQLRPHWVTNLTHALGLLLVGGYFFFISLTPDKRGVGTGRLIYDADFYISRIGLALMSAPLLIYYALNLVRNTIFYERGLLYEGSFWAWAEFQGYDWQTTHPQDPPKLHLHMKRASWLAQTLSMRVPSEVQPKVAALLAQHIGSADVKNPKGL